MAVSLYFIQSIDSFDCTHQSLFVYDESEWNVWKYQHEIKMSIRVIRINIDSKRHNHTP